MTYDVSTWQAPEPQRIAVANNKGGVGKTTTSVFFALALALGRGAPREPLSFAAGPRVLLIGTDKSGDLARWAHGAGEDWPENVAVRHWPAMSESAMPEDFVRGFRAEADQYTHVVVDTPPNGQVTVRAALRLVDKLVIPVGPATLEIQGMQDTLNDVAEVGLERDIRVALLMTRSSRSATDREVIRQALVKRNLPILSVEIPFLVQYLRADKTVPAAPDDLAHYWLALQELIHEGRCLNNGRG